MSSEKPTPAAEAPRLTTPEQLQQLHATHYVELWRYAVKLTADPERAGDAVHDVFLQLWNHRKDVGAVRSWRLHLLSAVRGWVLQRMHPAAPLFPLSADDFTLREPSLANKLALNHALETLSPHQREILYLRYHDGMDDGDIAELLDLRYQAVVAHLHQAMLHLRERDVLKYFVDL